MDIIRKIGKKNWLFLLFFLCISKQDFKLSLKALSMNGKSIEQVVMNNNFNLKLSIVGKSLSDLSNQDYMHIDSLLKKSLGKNFKIKTRQLSSFIKIVNGHNTEEKNFLYVIEPLKIGKFEIGPINFDDLYSNLLRIDVVKIEDAISSGIVNSENSCDEPENLKFILALPDAFIKNEQNSLFVGQSIPFQLKLLYQNDTLNPLNIVFPESKNIKFSKIKKPILKEQKYDNKVYYCIEWSGLITFIDSGDLQIPSIVLDYEYDLCHSSQSVLSMVFRSFNKHNDKIYTKPIKLKIENLPKTNDERFKDCLVGRFKDFKVAFDKSEINFNSASKLNVIFRAKFFEPDLKKYNLTNVPESLKVYESKCSQVDSLFNWIDCSCDFVIQPLSDGVFVFPEQYLYYFDVVEKSYKILKSDSLELKVNLQQNDMKSNLDVEQVIQKDFLINEFNKNIAWGKYQVDWWIVLLLVLIAMFLIFYSFILKIFIYCYFKIDSFLHYKFVFYYSKKQLAKAYKNQDLGAILKSLEGFFSIKLKINNFNFNLLNNYFQNSNEINHNKINLFNNFVADMFDKKFNSSDKNLDKLTLKHFYYESLNWMSYFNKILKIVILSIGLLNINIFSSQENLIEDIISLRRLQVGNTYSNYIEIEDRIDTLKNSCDQSEKFDCDLNSGIYKPSEIFWYKIFGLLPLIFWQILLILYWWIIYLFGIIKPRLNNFFKFIIIILGFALFIPTIFLTKLKLNKYALIKVDDAKIYAGPGIDYPFISKNSYLKDIRIIKEQESWSLISNNSSVGWIENCMIEKI